MVGGIVGVGVFGLPYVFAESGFVVGALWLFGLGALLTAMLLMLSEVALKTTGSHRIVGYIEAYLGPKVSRLALLAFAGMLWGAMIAYMIVGGGLLHTLFSPAFGGGEWVYALLLIAVAALFVSRGLAFASRVEAGAILVLLFLFVYIILVALPEMHPLQLVEIHLDHVMRPYGILLFALAGIGVVPEIKDVLGRKEEKRLPHVVVLGMMVIITLYFLFSLVVVGVTGDATTPSAIQGLIPVLGPTFGVIGTLLGSSTILSVFIMLGLELQNTFRFDFGMKRWPAFVLVFLVPLLVYFGGVHAFVDVIGFVGAVFTGFLAMLIIWSYERMRKTPVCVEHHCLNVPSWISWALLLVFAAGIVFELVETFIPHLL